MNEPSVPPSIGPIPGESAIPSALPLVQSDEAPPQRSATIRDYLGISLFYLALSFFWGAMLTIALPAHIETLFGSAQKDNALKILVASGAAFAGISQILFGALSDDSHSRFGRRRPFLLLGTLLAAIPILVIAHAQTLALLVLTYCLLQLLLNVAIGPYNALMHDVIPAANHAIASTWIGIAGLLGRIGGPLVAVLILGHGLISSNSPTPAINAHNAAQSQTNFASLMTTFAVVLLLIMGITLGLVRERPLSGTSASNMSLGERITETFRVPLKPYPDFRWLIVSRFGIMMGIYTLSNFLLYYIRDALGFSEGESLKVLQNFLIFSTIAGLVGTLPAGALSTRIGMKRVLYGANIICMVAGVCFAFASNLTLAYAAACIFGAGYGAFSAIDWALATSLLPENEPAKYMGVWGLSDTVSQVIAPLLAGSLASLFNNLLPHGMGYRALMILALCWFLLGTLALKPIRERGLQTTA